MPICAPPEFKYESADIEKLQKIDGLLDHILGGHLVAAGNLVFQNCGLLAGGSSGHSQFTAHSTAALLFAADKRCMEAEGMHVSPVHPLRLGYILPQKSAKAMVRCIPEDMEVKCDGLGAPEFLGKKEGMESALNYKAANSSEWPVLERDVFEGSGVYLMDYEVDHHPFKFLGHLAHTFQADRLPRLPDGCLLMDDNTLRSQVSGRVLAGFSLDKARLISILHTPRGLVHDSKSGRVIYGSRLTSGYEKKLRLLTVLLHGGVFHEEVRLLAMRLYKISIVPDSSIHEVSIEDLMYASGGLLNTEQFAEGGGWRRDLRDFVREMTFGPLLRAYTGEPIGHNMDEMSVMDVTDPEEPQAKSRKVVLAGNVAAEAALEGW